LKRERGIATLQKQTRLPKKSFLTTCSLTTKMDKSGLVAHGDVYYYRGERRLIDASNAMVIQARDENGVAVVPMAHSTTWEHLIAEFGDGFSFTL
jgi:hypothetical protein